MWLDNLWISMPLFCVVTLVAYMFSNLIGKITGQSWVRPLLSSILILSILMLFEIPFETYETATFPFRIFLGLSIVSLGWFFYDQMDFLKANYKVILIGSTIGSLVSMSVSSLVLCMIDLPNDVFASLLPQHALSPFAISASHTENGTVGLTALLVMCSGFLGAAISPFLPSRISDFAKVFAVQCSCPSLEFSTIQGVLSGVVAGISGTVTTLLLPFYMRLLC